LTCLHRMRASLPDEIRKAMELQRESERYLRAARQEAQRILEEAKKEAERILDHAQQEAERLLADTPILQQAQRRAQECWRQPNGKRKSTDAPPTSMSSKSCNGWSASPIACWKSPTRGERSWRLRRPRKNPPPHDTRLRLAIALLSVVRGSLFVARSLLLSLKPLADLRLRPAQPFGNG